MNIPQIQANALKYSDCNISYIEICNRFNWRFSISLETDDEDIINFAGQIDYFQIHYVEYLVGGAKTLHQVFYDLIQISKNEYFCEETILFCMNEVYEFLSEKEISEAMILYKHSSVKILKRLKVLADSQKSRNIKLR